MGLRSWEIAAYAVYLEGGGSRLIHTEDVALRCFKLAPDSFSWVKYPQYPDKDVVRHALVHARDPANGSLVRGRSGKGRGLAASSASTRSRDGWRLTEGGVKWILNNEDRLVQELHQREPRTDRQELLHKVARLRGHTLFKMYHDQPQGFSPSLGGLAELLRCRVDAERPTWDRRFERLLNEARLAEQQDLVRFLEACRTRLESFLANQS